MGSLCVCNTHVSSWCWGLSTLAGSLCVRYTHVSMRTGRSQSRRWKSSTITLPSHWLEKGSLTEPKAHCVSQASWPVNSQDLPVSVPQLWSYRYPYLPFYAGGAWVLSSGPYAYRTSPLIHSAISPALGGGLILYLGFFLTWTSNEFINSTN